MTRIEILLTFAWAALLGLVLALPVLTASATPDDDLTRHTVRLALLFYGIASALMLTLSPAEWAAKGRGRLARTCWSLAWLTYLVHLFVAFRIYHHGSHADAVRHTHDVTGFGEGIYVSHFFTLVWTVDVAAWWLKPRGYAGRSAWFDRLLHGFMAFIIFCGMVVYETGFIRWAGVALFAALGALWLWRACTRTAFRYTTDGSANCG